MHLLLLVFAVPLLLLLLLLVWIPSTHAAPLQRQRMTMRQDQSRLLFPSSSLLKHISKQASILIIASSYLVPMQTMSLPALAAEPATPLIWKSGKNPVVQNKNDPKEVCISQLFSLLLCTYVYSM